MTDRATDIHALGDDALAIVFDRLRREYAKLHASTPDEIDALLSSQNADGGWADLSTVPRADDPTPGRTIAEFVRRLAKFAVAMRQVDDAARRDALESAVHRGLAYWFATGSRYTRHWYYEIGEPLHIACLMTLFADRLNEVERSTGLAVLRRPVSENGTLIYAGSPATGQNLIWQAMNQLHAAALTNDPIAARRYVRQIDDEMRVTTSEGVQPDFSFHQHDAQLYSGGYGESYTRDCARIVEWLHGTSLALSEESVETLVAYVLDGQQWMTRGVSWDFSVMGRELARRGRDASGLADACERLAGLGLKRAPELRAFARRLQGVDAPETAPAGTRLFWRSDFAVHVRPAFYASVRMSSTRVVGNESGNGEAESGYHLGHGAVCVMRDGAEFRDLFPLWDWRRVPGVTCPYTPEIPLPLDTWGRTAFGTTDFAGGTSDGVDGCCAMHLARGGVSARKAWFFMGDVVVCLGAAITADDASHPVNTSIAQARGRGTISRGERDGYQVIHHDGLAYLVPAQTPVHATLSPRTGSWRQVDRFHGSTEPFTEPVFSLWIDHGQNVVNASYEYHIAAASTVADAMAVRLPHVICNESDAQAVVSSDGTLLQMVVYTAGSVPIGGGVVDVDGPCALQIRRLAPTRYRITAGNPTHKLATLSVVIDGQTIRFDFDPTPAYRGRPVSVEIETDRPLIPSHRKPKEIP